MTGVQTCALPILLAAMETAGKEIEDDTMRQAMKDSGIGTPATLLDL